MIHGYVFFFVVLILGFVDCKDQGYSDFFWFLDFFLWMPRILMGLLFAYHLNFRVFSKWKSQCS